MNCRSSGTRWRWWTLRQSCLRFAHAVPRRQDRRELRRSFRATAREVARERKGQVAAGLQALASSHVRVRTVRCGATGDTIVEFGDGTVLDLRVREGKAGLWRLAGRSPPVLYLDSVDPCFGHLWFGLHFVAMFENRYVLAQVRHFEERADTSGRDTDRGEETGHGQA